MHFDVAVVGAGPAGSVAAMILARAGARVALIDKASFPRDKACGDLVGPRGVQLLADLGITVPHAGRAGDMVVVGPTGRRTRLPALPGHGYADHALVAPRHAFDDLLRTAALEAGAIPVTGRCTGLQCSDQRTSVDVRLQGAADRCSAIDADAVVGADGATSAVARAAGLIDEAATLWAFALRGYVPGQLAEPVIVLRDERPWRALPGYGWAFPGVGGAANVGLGLGLGARRADSRLVRQRFAAFCNDLPALGILDRSAAPERQIGGWLRMGGAGIVPARGRLLLVGDAAGLVNPLQGEGIGPAMQSAQLAALALLEAPARPAQTYRAALHRQFGPYFSATVPLHISMLGRPVVTAALGRALTAPGLRRAVGSTWSLFWNDLAVDAEPGAAATSARLLRNTAGLLGRPMRMSSGLVRR